MKPRRGHLRFDLVAARHNEHLVRRQNQPMTAKLLKTAARGLEIPHVELEQIFFPAAFPPRLRMKGCFHWSNPVT